VVHIPPQEGEPLNALEGTTAAGAGGDIDGATFDQLRYKNSCLVADSFGEAGVNVVLELDVTGDVLRREVPPELRSRPFYLVQLLPSEMMVTGSGGLTFERWQGRRERFRRETAADGLWLDNYEGDSGRDVARLVLSSLHAAVVEG
jgi:hypothetical protein